MKDAIEVLFDNRFGWRFKLANLIMGDYLRNSLAVGGLCSIDHIKDRIEYLAEKDRDKKYLEIQCGYLTERLNEIHEVITEVMEM